MKISPKPKFPPPPNSVESFGVVEGGPIVYKMKMPPGGSVVTPVPLDQVVRVEGGEIIYKAKRPPTVLELTLHPDPKADSAQLAIGSLDLLSAINQLDRTMGGEGYDKTGHAIKDGVITFTLVPVRRAGAAKRIRRIAASIQPPVAVLSLRVRLGNVA
jgi:hypothetical protein